MFKKTLIFAVLVSIALAHVNVESQEVGNKVDDLLRKLRDEVDRAVSKAQAALDHAKAKVSQTADKIQASARKAMQSTINGIRAKIDELKAKAKKAGVNIDSCLAGNENALLGLPNQYAGNMVHCVSDQITKAIGYAQDGLNNIKKIVDEVENIKKEIKDCGHGLKSVKCLAKLAAKIERDITTLPGKIEADIAATVLLISQLEEKVEKCASDQTKGLGKEAESIFGKISVCVAGKLIGH